MKLFKHSIIATICSTALLMGLLSGVQAEEDVDYILHTFTATDSLPELAEKHLGSADLQYELLEVNGLQNRLSVYPGMRLMIPKAIRTRAVASAEQAGNLLAEADVAGANELAREPFHQAKDYFAEAGFSFTKADYDKCSHWSELAIVKANEALEMAKVKGVQHLRFQLVRKFGEVHVSKDEGVTWKSFARLDSADENDFVRTGKGSTAQLVLPDDSEIDLAPESTLQVATLTRDARARAQKTALRIIKGEILGRIKKKRSTDTFDVSTPAMNIIIRGTTIRVATDLDKNTSKLGVLEGKTQVQVDGELVTVSGNEGIVVTAKGDVKDLHDFQVFSLVPAPVIAKRFASLETPSRRAALAWSNPEMAPKVLFELSKDERFIEVIDSREVAGSSVTTDLLKEGTYFWRVTGISGKGLKGQMSDTQSLRITTDMEFDVVPDRKLLEINGAFVTGPETSFRTVPARKDNSIIGYEYSWDNKAYTTYTSAVARDIQGKHVLYVRAITEDGTISEPVLNTFTVDSEKPTLTIKKDESNVASASLLNLKFETSDNVAVDRLEIRQNKGEFKAYGDSAQFNVSTLNPGVVEARVIDRVGNASAIQRVVIGGK